MLRTVHGAGFEAAGRGLRRRWIFRTGSLESDRALTGRELRRLLTAQESAPVAVLTDGSRTWWMTGGEVVSAHADLDAADIAALLRERDRKTARRLERAHALQTQESLPDHARRAPIPLEVRREVWARDGGRCRECGTDFDLQYDHVIPVALGGGTAAANLQLLCGACNRRKGATLG